MVYQEDLKRLGCTSLDAYFDLIIQEDSEGNIEVAKELLDELSPHGTPISQRRMFFMHIEKSKINLAMFK